MTIQSAAPSGDGAGAQAGAAPRPAIRCRPIAHADLEALAALLTRGFSARDLAFWKASLEGLRAWTVAARLPGLGFVLADGDQLVGCLLTIYSADGRRCNMSSWCVEEGYRRFGGALVNLAVRDRLVTYVNVSSEPHTRPIIEAQGFRRYTAGALLCVPLVSMIGLGRAAVSWATPEGVDLDPVEVALVENHRGFGCIAFWCVSGGRAYPFVVVQRQVKWGLPVAQLIYCAPDTDWRKVSHAVGRALARHGLFLLLLDAEGPLTGLAGRFLPGRMPKYARGPNTPAYRDLAYTEIAVIGT